MNFKQWLEDSELQEGKKDACYYKVKARYAVWPSAYSSGALVKCRKKGAKNWGKSKNEQSMTCEFCGSQATSVEMWDEEVPVCDMCSAGFSESDNSTANWPVQQAGEGKFYRVNPNAKTPAERYGSRQLIDPTQERVIATIDQFGQAIPAPILQARKDFLNKASVGSQFSHKSYPGSIFQVTDSGDLIETTTGRMMGNIQQMANVIEPNQITWSVATKSGISEGTFDLEKEKGLHGWFSRNKGKGWIDCKKSSKGNLVACGREKTGKGAEREYPACRPTLSACNKKGTRRKKSSKPISWK